MNPWRLLLVFPALFLAEVFFGEAGTWARFGGVSIREALFVAAVLSLYGCAGLLWRRLRFSRLDLAVLFFLMVNLAWGLLLPALHGRSLELAFADFGGVLVLALYFPVAALVRGGALSWEGPRGLFMDSALLLALLQLGLWTLGTWRPGITPALREFLLRTYDAPDIYTGPMPDGFFRVMPVTALLLIPAFFTLSHVLVTGRRPLLAAGLLLLVGGGLVVAYSRTFWLAVLLGLSLALAGLLLRRRAGRPARGLRGLGRELLPGIVFVAAFALIILGGAVHETAADPPGGPDGNSGGAPASTERAASTLDAQDRSVAIKLRQIPPLLSEWRESPVLGEGFGGHAEDFVRSRESPFSYEMLAPALLMKLGALGALLWLAPMVYLLADGLRSAVSTGTADRGRFAVAGLVAFALAVQSNPLLFNSVGMTAVLFYLLELSDLRDVRKPRRRTTGETV